MGWIHIWIVYSVTLTLTLHMCIMRTTSLLVITSFDHFSDRNNLHDGSAERRTVRTGWERSCEITELTLPHILIYTQKAHAKATIPVPRKHWLCNFLSSATVPDTRECSHLLCISFSVWKTCELLYLNKMWVQQPLQHTQKIKNLYLCPFSWFVANCTNLQFSLSAVGYSLEKIVIWNRSTNFCFSKLS